MPLPKNILFPVDYSDRCRSIWPAVAAMGQAFNAPITMLHAAELRALDAVEALSAPQL